MNITKFSGLTHTKPQEAEIGEVDNSIDNIELNEFQEVLKTTKDRKAAGTDNLNVELFEYGRTLLQESVLAKLRNTHRLENSKNYIYARRP